MKKPAYITDDNKVRWHATLAFDKRWSIGRVTIKAKMNRGDGMMGRLGGGWAWKFGILAGRKEFIIELFVMSIRVSWHKPTAPVSNSEQA